MSAGRPLVLASTSPYRAELLARLELPFDTASPDFDERAEDGRFDELGAAAFALHLARGKARSVAAERPDAWVLAADQTAVLHAEDGPRVLHKPGSPERAVDQLLAMAGRTHELVNGVVLLDAATGGAHELVDRQRLTMRAFERAEAQAYVERHAPTDCVGSYRIEGPGIALFERIESDDFTGIVGLPLLAVARLLREVGLLAR